MFRDKLTRLALRRANERVLSGYIIRSKPGMFDELVEFAREFELAGLVRRTRFLSDIIREVTPFGPLGLGLRELRRFNMVAGIFPREAVFDMAEWKCVEKVFSDEPVYALQYPTVPPEGVFEVKRKTKKPLTFTTTYWTKKLIGADIANSRGYTGRGVLVAVCDTGARTTHEQISGRVQTLSVLRGQYVDFNGHGSWCTTCIGGRNRVDDAMSRITGRGVVCEGMAPDCDLLAIKCLGYGIGMGSYSSIIESVEVALDYHADVISMSLGGPLEVDRPEDDPQFYAFEEAVRSGSIPVCAAGNSGPDKGTINSPGGLPNTIGVGAYDPITGEVAEFSSRGPTPWGTTGVDCIAPGVDIDSGTVGECDFAADHRESRYSPLSGTSMATPHASGIIALMRQAVKMRAPWKTFTFEDVIDMLKYTAEEPPNPDTGYGLITWQRFERWMHEVVGVRV